MKNKKLFKRICDSFIGYNFKIIIKEKTIFVFCEDGIFNRCTIWHVETPLTDYRINLIYQNGTNEQLYKNKLSKFRMSKRQCFSAMHEYIKKKNNI